MLLDDEYGAILVAFDDWSRGSYSDNFTNDFAVNITVRGFGFLQRNNFNEVGTTFDDKPKDWLSEVDFTLVAEEYTLGFPRKLNS